MLQYLIISELGWEEIGGMSTRWSTLKRWRMLICGVLEKQDDLTLVQKPSPLIHRMSTSDTPFQAQDSHTAEQGAALQVSPQIPDLYQHMTHKCKK